MTTQRRVTQRRIYQGVDEQISYTVTTTPWGSTPSSVIVVAKDEDDANTDVSATVLSGSPSVNGDVITLPILKALTAGGHYRIEVKFTTGGNILECWFRVNAEL